MSLASDVGNLVAHYRGSAAGYDVTNARLIDQSGNGMHAPKLAGTPAFAAYSGTTALTMRGDTYFGCPLINAQPVVPLPTRFTAVGVFWASLAGTDVFDFMMGVQRDYAGTDPAWKSPSTAFESSAMAAFGLRMRANGNGNAMTAGSLDWPVNGNFAAGAWNVLQFVADPDGSQYRMRLGTGPWVATTIPTGRQLQVLDDWRLGYKATPIDTSGGHDFALAQMIIFNGDPANESSGPYTSLINALALDPTAGDTQPLTRAVIGAAASGANSDITSLSGLTTALPVAAGGTGGTSASAARTALGLGSMATESSGAVSITGGSIAGITDLAIADGGTGASTAQGARAALQIKKLYPSGRWFAPESITVTVTTNTSAASTVHAFPVLLREPFTLAGVGVRLTTVSSGGNIQFAVYAADPATGYPTGSALYSGSSLSTTTAGFLSDTSMTLAVTPGIYWIMYNQDATAGGVAKFTGVSGSGVGALVGSSQGIDVYTYAGFVKGVAFGTWPTFTGVYSTDGWADDASNTTAAIAFKVQ